MVKRQILLIDDDEDDLFLFVDALEELTSEIKCLTAFNGMEALCLLKNSDHLPSLIFLDLNMPLMNGFECLKQIKQNQRLEHIPIVIFSTSSNPADEQNALLLGASIFLTKTADFRSLKSSLKKILHINFLLLDGIRQ